MCRIYTFETHFDDTVNANYASCTVYLNSQTKNDRKDAGEAFQRSR
jgi:hypothetical protein